MIRVGVMVSDGQRMWDFDAPAFAIDDNADTFTLHVAKNEAAVERMGGSMLAEFIAEIRATETDTDLLIFADWLEERGQGLDNALTKLVTERVTDRLMGMPSGEIVKLTIMMPGGVRYVFGHVVVGRREIKDNGNVRIEAAAHDLVQHVDYEHADFERLFPTREQEVTVIDPHGDMVTFPARGNP